MKFRLLIPIIFIFFSTLGISQNRGVSLDVATVYGGYFQTNFLYLYQNNSEKKYEMSCENSGSGSNSTYFLNPPSFILSYNTSLNKNIALETGLGHIRNAYVSQVSAHCNASSYPYNSLWRISYEETYKSDYIILPINLKWVNDFNRGGINFVGGLYNSVLISSTVTRKVRDWYVTDDEYQEQLESNGTYNESGMKTYPVNKFDFGLSIGTEVYFKIGKHNRLNIKGLFRKSYTTAQKFEFEAVRTSYKYRNTFASLSIGWERRF